jgi:hypothetical protein
VAADGDARMAGAARDWLAVVLAAVALTLVLAVPRVAKEQLTPPSTAAVDMELPVLRPGALWLSPEELQGLPTAGPAWQRLLELVEEDVGRAQLSDQNSKHDVAVLGLALVAARTDDEQLRARVVREILSVVGTEELPDEHCAFGSAAGARGLAIGRNLVGYILAADLIGLQPANGQQDAVIFARWVDDLRRRINCPSNGRGIRNTIAQGHAESGSNGSALQGAARVAASLYLGDRADVEDAWRTYRRYSGDRSVGSELDLGRGVRAGWAADPDRPVAINPAGSTRDGHRLDGAIVNDLARGGDRRWPPEYTQYPWEGISGYFVQAELLARAGYPAWEVEERAPLRAMQFLWEAYGASGDERWWDHTNWAKHLGNRAYGTSYPVPEGDPNGKNLGWTDWTHALLDDGPG